MNKRRLFRLGWLISTVLVFGGASRATDEVPCLVFTGHGSTEKHCLDLATHNRITFGDDAMTITSSRNDDVEPVTLLYSAFHHLEIMNDIPQTETGVENIGINSESTLLYNSATKALTLTAEPGEVYTTGVFDIDGKLLLTGKLQTEETMLLESLSGGVYIAIAVNGNSRLTLKFVHK